MVKRRCKWVHDRLPLLVGDELCGLDRRRAERHLIGCPHCRQHQAALGQALEALRSVAATSTSSPDAPSLWPALARQIRESRRPVPTPAFAFASALAWPRANPWPALGFSLGLGLVATIGAGIGIRYQVAAAQSHLTAKRPSTAAAAIPVPGPHLVAAPAALRPRPRPDKPRREQSAPAADQPAETPPAPPRLDYDLEHLRPMSPDTRDVRDTKFTY